MELILTNTQLELLQNSNDFNVLCVLQNTLTENKLNLNSSIHVEYLYDFCCNNENIEMIALLNNILKLDRSVIKPFQVNIV